MLICASWRSWPISVWIFQRMKAQYLYWYVEFGFHRMGRMYALTTPLPVWSVKLLINVFWPSLRHWFYLSLSGLWYRRKINELSRFSFFPCIVLKAGKCMLETEYKWSVGKSLGCWWWPITAVLCHHTRYVWYGSPRLIAFDASSCFVDMHE